MPTLTELEARFIQYAERGEDVFIVDVDTLSQAHGIKFLCPLCFGRNNGRAGTHTVICWFVGKVPDTATPLPGRWTPQGTGLKDLTFVPSAGRSQSVLLLSGCGWHGAVTGGNAK